MSFCLIIYLNSELTFRNFDFISHNLEFISHNSVYLKSHDYEKKDIIVRYKLAIA